MARRKHHRTTYRRRKLVKFKLKKETIYTITAILFCSAAGLLFTSLMKYNAPLLGQVRQLQVGYFGVLAYLFPFIPLSIGLLFLRLKLFFARPNISLGISLLFVSLAGMGRTGIAGQLLWENVSFLISGVGAWLLFVGSLAIGLSILLDTSLDEIMFFCIAVITNIAKMLRGSLWNGSVRSEKKGVFPSKELQVKGGVMPAVSGLTQTQKKAVHQQSSATAEPVEGFITTSVTNQPGEAAVWEYPPISLLHDISNTKADAGDIKRNAHIIEQTLDSFGINAHVVEVNLGPAVAQYALEIALGTKLSKITGLSNDLALALAAPTGQIRIEAPIPGRSMVGVEVPNRLLRIVTLKEMLLSEQMQRSLSKLTVPLGLDVSGSPVIADLTKMPHALVAGTTGSGKSVMMNSLISSLLFRTTPQELRLILIDPKRVELTLYNDIPHLLTPVIVEVDQTLSALKWAQGEMDRRYKMFAEAGARNIESYNEVKGYQALPFIVIFIDELADIMIFAPAEVEDTITRIAQMARATGIHLVLSTQRPSVNVITGLIKANIPSRIAFNVSSMIDSRVILDMPGAEKLLGKGDMLYIPPDQAKPTRIQGAFVSEKEVKNLVDFLKKKVKAKGIPIEYTEEVTQQKVTITRSTGLMETTEGQDPLYEEARLVVMQYDRASASLLQRRLKVGYARAARILDQLEAAGIVSPAEGSKPREVLMRTNQSGEVPQKV
ncbi:DUF87 domain-containing protein [Candidatus Roizmanbacteria bacterium]|nr:DUF87 domain-containing protein [Candidatus Roizmanbacteria bacterium]